MKKTMIVAFTICALILSTVTMVSATLTGLHDNGDGTITDHDTNLMWLADANYSKTSGYDADGRMTWWEANTWAGTLVFAGYDDWRLPTVTDTGTPGCDWSLSGGTECGYNVDTSTSEMAHIFYDELGNLGYYDTSGSWPQPGWGLTNTGPFSNLQPSWYWSGTEYALNAFNEWDFYFLNGYQNALYKVFNFYAWAVRDITPIPEPSTILLLGFGLAGLIIYQS